MGGGGQLILTIRPATKADAEWVAENIRDEDKREIEAASGKSPKEIVPLSLQVSSECYSIRLQRDGRIEEQPCALFGVGADPSEPLCGVMWLLGTNELRRGALSIIREAPKWLDHFNRKYPLGIHNYVDTRNDLHIRWLMLTGFSFERVVDIRGVPFVYAVRYWST